MAKFKEKATTDEFDVGGKVPCIDDDRVSFVKGLFQDTLDEFLVKFRPGLPPSN